MTMKRDLAEIEFQYTTGAIGYEEYRRGVKAVWANKALTSEPKEQVCALEFNPEPGIAVRTKLARGGIGR